MPYAAKLLARSGHLGMPRRKIPAESRPAFVAPPRESMPRVPLSGARPAGSVSPSHRAKVCRARSPLRQRAPSHGAGTAAHYGRYRRVYVNYPITLLTSSTDVLVGHDDGVMREAATPITPVEALK